MEPKPRRILIIILIIFGAFFLLGGLILADAAGLIGPEEVDCCATGFDPGPPEPPAPIPADKF